ncbi:hypothetical protein LCI18_005386 [Fusarium solani-melongenae]|uniref:Uncharacterized protein n=1 Tax=Fusarium solani subsp. cucurbitae TaxID=2747967 RepID=A0ACD3YZT9_FUSSC|nr:hypothetical protein LCI18_005386 [Fusarium solani-melongenae]
MASRSDSGVPLLKTCQTCFHAKIRCEKSQDSGKCDRCLRLGKTCVFNPSRRRKALRPGPPKNLDASPSRSRSPSITSANAAPTSKDATGSSPAFSITPGSIDTDATSSPFARGLLSFEHGQDLLDLFRIKMTPHFPFVVVQENVMIQDLVREKPALCVAILSAASHGDPKLQRALGQIFNEIVAIRLIKGPFATIDMLQGLLVHLAWAHYQQGRMKYSQHLSLAGSIVSDMRLDRPRVASLWALSRETKHSVGSLNHDEMRALAGTYYLSSSSAVLLQKSHHFRYTPYILDCCHQLTARTSQPTDKHLPYIIYLQKLTEEVDDAVTGATSTLSTTTQQLPAELHRIRERYMTTKASLPFPLSESPTILLQLHVLDLLICQPSPDGVSYGPNGFQSLQAAGDQNRLLDWLSQSISAAKSLISVVLVLPQGEEGAMPNTGWIMLYCAVSLAVRLDLVAAQAENAQTTGHLRRILDMPHTLRQIVLRMEAASGPDAGDGEKDPFYGLSRRARRIEQWYLERCGPTDSPDVASLFNSSVSSPANALSAPDLGLTPSSFGEPSSMVPSLQVTGETDESWTTNLLADFDAEIGMNNFLYTGPFEFLGDHQF